MARQMEVMRVEGLAELLRGNLLTTPQSRMVDPDRDTREKVALIGNAFIQHAAEDPVHAERTIYTAYQWPETGPATFGMVWAVNVRAPQEQATGHPFFWRAFTETEEPTDKLLSRFNMEQDLARYAVQTFGGLRLV